MASPSLQTLQRVAQETGHDPGTLEKVLRLLDVLQGISGDPLLSERLALKGGTALNIFHFQLDRLSVDIDLNYIGAVDRNKMLAERPEIEAALNRLLAEQSYRVRRQPDEHAGGKWLSRYSSAIGGNATLEIDLNYMARQPLFGTHRMSSQAIGGSQANNILVIDLYEVIAGKLVALFDRSAGRDLFDARRILAISNVDWQVVKAAVLAIGACARTDWRKRTINDIGVDLNELRRNLSICLPRAYFDDAGGFDNWVEETVVMCRERYAFLLALAKSEQEFLDGILDHGEIDADLLNAPPELKKHISQMPMLAWKCQNVKRLNKSE
jgi:predicted nucleotidyltransferase component of viral defense system